ncbi:hypothetical protein [Nostoc linckia]|jgi:hypothetical protein|nr:hypothetical protein [Nostoc linckia]
MTLQYLIDEKSIGENIEELIILALASEDDEYQDRIIYLPLP